MLDGQIREMERKLHDKQTSGDGKRGAGGKKGSSAKSSNQRQAKKLEDQLQLVSNDNNSESDSF